MPGQVVGGRWKPLHYVLRASIFADQLLVCNIAGACFVANDSPFAFKGTATIQLVNMMNSTRTPVQTRTLDLDGGPKVTEWFCAETKSNKDAADLDGDAELRTDSEIAASQPAPTYSHHLSLIPVNNANFTREIDGIVEHDCEVACNAQTDCIGFTRMVNRNACWLYTSASNLKVVVGTEWWQKPGTKPIPAPPVPPTPPAPGPVPVPPEIQCSVWKATSVWNVAGCDSDGSNCLLDIQIHNGSGAVVSWSKSGLTPISLHICGRSHAHPFPYVHNGSIRSNADAVPLANPLSKDVNIYGSRRRTLH